VSAPKWPLVDGLPFALFDLAHALGPGYCTHLENALRDGSLSRETITQNDVLQLKRATEAIDKVMVQSPRVLANEASTALAQARQQRLDEGLQWRVKQDDKRELSVRGLSRYLFENERKYAPGPLVFGSSESVRSAIKSRKMKP
jgi:hypothetical protein